jgi:hypothetical protein
LGRLRGIVGHQRVYGFEAGHGGSNNGIEFCQRPRAVATQNKVPDLLIYPIELYIDFF